MGDVRRSKAGLAGILLYFAIVLVYVGFGIAYAELSTWDCTECGRKGITKNYCGGCGYPSPWIREVSGKPLREDFEKKGNIVKFGHYEQDNNLKNGQEEIEWIVLDVQEGKSLLLSVYGLDEKPYNTDFSNTVTWEKCTLRSWLNKDFADTAFSTDEKKAILNTTVDNGDKQRNTQWNSYGGNTTQDQIFLLSYSEVFGGYFNSDYDRRCAPTESAIANEAYTGNYVTK